MGFGSFSLKSLPVQQIFTYDLININPYRQILGNSSKIFSEFSFFRALSLTDYWKTHPIYLKNTEKFRIKFAWMGFLEIGLAHARKIVSKG